MSSTEHAVAFQTLLRDDDIDRFDTMPHNNLYLNLYWTGLQKIQHIIPYLFCLHSIIVKLKQHKEFFPAFHDLTVDILQTLGKILQHSDSFNHLNALDIFHISVLTVMFKS